MLALIAAPLGPFTPSTIEEVLRTLPAEVRAQVRWAPNAFRGAFRKLLQAHEVDADLLAQVTAEVFGFQVSLRAAFEVLSIASREVLLEMLKARGEEQALLIQRGVPADAHGEAARALMTSLTLAGIGVEVALGTAPDIDSASIAQVVEQLPNLSAHEAMAGLRGFVLISAVLTGVESGEGSAERLRELVRWADQECLAFAAQLAQLDSDNPQLRLPWYFEPRTGAAQIRHLSLWFEQRKSRNARAADLLETWASEENESEQKDAWNHLRKALDEDRTSSGRPLFPSTT